MTISKSSRRNFLKSGGSVMGASWLAINLPLIVSAGQTALHNKESGTGYNNISVAESVELGALVNQIIPPDDTPGAAEIGVVYFIDVALGDFMSSAAPMIREGLADLQQKTRSAYSNIQRFSELSVEDQTKMLKSVEDTAMFGTLHFLTLCGMFCLPSYSGNRENAGWDLIGFDHRHAWQPPFGYYDAAVNGQLSDEGDDHEQV